MLFFSPSVPYPPSYFLPQTFSEKNDLIYVNVDSMKVEFYTQDSVLMGYYEKQGDFVTFVIHDIGFVKTYNLFNSEIQRLSREVILVFKAKPGIKVEDIASFDDLLYFKDVRVFNVKHDKDKVFTNIIQVSEFYIEDVAYLQEFDKKNYGDTLSVEYKRVADFWKRCDCVYYQEPNQYLWQNLQRDY